MAHLWLRSETKAFEKRTALTPQHAKELIDAGHKITVEKFAERIFKDAEYEALGCEIVESGTWTNAPKEAFILGVKEIENEGQLLSGKHIHFAHVFKNQDGWKEDLGRFKRGGATLYDLEFLTHENGRRVAAFGFSAGVTGAAVSLLIWVQKKQGKNPNFKIPFYYENEKEVIDEIKKACTTIGYTPNALVIGALGRVGSGATNFFEKCGINVTKWDMAETAPGGPFKEILEHELFVNAIYLRSALPPFITKELLKENKKLSVIADISCDPNNPYNPLPVYDKITTFDNPTVRVTETPLPVDLMAIDHLPSFLPRESSIDYSEQLLPHLKNLLEEGENNPIWKRAREIFDQKCSKL